MIAFLVSFAVLLVTGVPIVFSMLGSSMIYLLVNDFSLAILFEITVNTISESFVLLAVPFFIMAACIMNSGGITDNIFRFASNCVGWIPGGLGHANILASVIFAGMSGSAVADAGGLGQIELKAMKKAGYDDDFSLAITGASSMVGPIIPPSIPAVLYGVAAGVSIGRLLVAGIIPGLLMALSMAILVYIQSVKRNYPKEPFPTAAALWSSFTGAIFELLTPVILIGGIVVGIFTPTEAASVSVMYALVLVLLKGNMRFQDIPKMLKETADSVCTILPLVGSAGIFAWVMSIERIPVRMSMHILSYVSGGTMAMLSVIALLIIAGMFLDGSVAIMVLTPIMVPIVKPFGIDLVHFGIVMIITLMLGLTTPPFGMVAFVLSTVSGVPFERIVKALTPYAIAVFIALLFITFVPETALYLPRLFFG